MLSCRRWPDASGCSAIAGGARRRRRGREAATDAVAVEAALEVRLNGQPFSVTMRTPGADRELAAGFPVHRRHRHRRRRHRRRARRSVRRCRRRHPDRGAPAAVAAQRDARRQVTTTSSCGMCGPSRPRVDAADRAARRADRHRRRRCDPRRCRRRSAPRQETFAATGGLHAAALCTLDGDIVDTAEDVGRHNAVDKIIGRRLLAGRCRWRRAAVRQRPHVVRDPAEGVAGRRPARRRGVGALEPGDRAGRGGRHHADRLRPRRPLQHLHASGADRAGDGGPWLTCRRARAARRTPRPGHRRQPRHRPRRGAGARRSRRRRRDHVPRTRGRRRAPCTDIAEHGRRAVSIRADVSQRFDRRAAGRASGPSSARSTSSSTTPAWRIRRRSTASARRSGTRPSPPT